MRRLFCLVVFLCVLCLPVCAAEPDQSDQVAGTAGEETTGEGQELPEGSPAPPVSVEVQLPDEPLPVVIQEDLPVSDAQPYAVTGSPYDGGLSTTTQSYFGGIIRKYAGVDYVAFRSDQYEYTLCYGDISLSGSSFSSSSCTVVRYSTRYDTTVSTSVETLNLYVGSQPVYSSLGSYPELEGVSQVVWSKVSCVAFAVLVLFCVLSVFFRPRGR